MILPPICPECIVEGVKARRDVASGATRDRCATHWRAVRKARKAAAHDLRVQKVYGLAPGEYEARYAEQGGVCAICQKNRGQSGRRLAVDHDHETGRVGKLLCQPCNYTLLGKFSLDTLKRAVAYLETHR